MPLEGVPRSSPFPSAAELDNGLRHTQQEFPKWTLRTKPAMIIGAPTPKWTNSIPGPKYSWNADVNKERQPVYTMRTRPKTTGEVGDGRPSSVQPSLDEYQRMVSGLSTVTSSPNFSFPSQTRWRVSKRAMTPEFMDPARDGGAMRGQLGAGRGPCFTIASRQGIPSEAELMSTRSPGPIYHEKPPKPSRGATLGKKLPSEGDIMSVRSPGPCNYAGSAMDVKKQAEVDSTKRRSFSCSFGIGSRWGGPREHLIKSGALARYDSGRGLGLKP